MEEIFSRMLQEFDIFFHTESACIEYLAQMRWPDGFICPYCESAYSWQAKRGLYHCCQCGIQTLVTAPVTTTYSMRWSQVHTPEYLFVWRSRPMLNRAGTPSNTPPLGTSRHGVNSGVTGSPRNRLASSRPRVFVAPIPMGELQHPPCFVHFYRLCS